MAVKLLSSEEGAAFTKITAQVTHQQKPCQQQQESDSETAVPCCGISLTVTPTRSLDLLPKMGKEKTSAAVSPKIYSG